MALTRRTLLASTLGAILAACTRGRAKVVREWLLFTTLLRVSTECRTQAAAEALCLRIHEQLRDCGPDLYGFGDGELAQVNQSIASGAAAVVSPRLAAALEQAILWRERSEGLVDPAIGSLVALWKFDDLTTADPPAVPDAAALQQAITATKAGFTLRDQSLQASSAAVRLDLGAIAKGVLLGELIPMLENSELVRVVVDLGGDVMALAHENDAAFRVAVANPQGGTAKAMLKIRSGEFVMTSGGYARFHTIDGRRYQHILDPRSGQPVEPASATVVSRDPVQADAAATALVVGGAGAFASVCDAMGVDKALLIDNVGEIMYTNALAERLI